MDRQEIRDSARRKLDEDPGTTNEFWSNEELNDYINEAYYFIWQLMLDSKYQGCLKEALLDIVSGQAEIALPADYHTARLVERVVASGTIPLWWDERFDESNYTAGVPSGSFYYLPTVRYVRDQLLLEPTPSEDVTGGIKFTYYFFPPRMTQDTDTPDIALKDFYHDLIVYRTVVIAKAKEEAIGQGGADLGAWGQLMAEREQKFKENIERPTTQRLIVKPFSLNQGGYNNYY